MLLYCSIGKIQVITSYVQVQTVLGVLVVAGMEHGVVLARGSLGKLVLKDLKQKFQRVKCVKTRTLLM